MNQYGNLESSLAGHLMKTYVKSALIALHLDGPAQASQKRACAP